MIVSNRRRNFLYLQSLTSLNCGVNEQQLMLLRFKIVLVEDLPSLVCKIQKTQVRPFVVSDLKTAANDR